jgi:phosphohistidine phosphatase
MKRLTLLRHAKSSWGEPGLSDFERPLNRRGERDAPAMGRRLAEAGARPSLMLTSPAVRTLSTARLVAEALGYPREFLQLDESLYLASAELLRQIVTRQDDRFSDLMIVAHNPGLTEFANQLSDRHVENLATAAVMVVDLPVGRWEELNQQLRGRCMLFDFPKNTLPPAPGTLERLDQAR